MRYPIDPRAEPEIEFTRWTEQLRTDLAQSVGGTLLRGARPVPIGGARPQPTFVAGALMGFSVIAREMLVGGYFWLRDREDNILVVAQVNAPDQTPAPVTQWFGPGGINIPDGGLFATCEADFEGVVYIRGSD